MALPARLGINIVRETDGYTVTQWDDKKKSTLFTIHAAKALEHTDSKITLHDVSITLYGENQDRNDRIYGDEFEYDQKAGVVRAVGVVHIDLQAAEDAQAAGGKAESRAAPKVLHVTTSGLVYVKNLGVAATSQPVEFEAGTMTGHATGADYSTDTGMLILHSAVSVSGMAGKRPVQMTAAAAQVDNRNQEIFLTGARGVSLEQTVEAQRATLHTRPDGTLARVEARGNVTREVKGSRLVAQQADVVLNAKSQPLSALLAGGVKYASDLPLLQRSGQADGVSIAFDAQGQAKQAVFTGAVHMNERTRTTEAEKEPWSSRDLSAAKVDATLVPVGKGNVQVQDVEATGSAQLTALNNGSLAKPRNIGRSEMAADVLTAHLLVTGDGKQPQLDTVTGRGHTLLHQATQDGIDQTSSGDMLDAKFRATPASGAVKTKVSSAVGGETVDNLLSAVQQGHVTMFRRAPAKAANTPGKTGNAHEDVERVTAQRADYDGDQDRMTLTGGVQMSDGESSLWTSQLVLDHNTGDAQASGTVKVDYVQDAPQSSAKPQARPAEPTNIVADRAEFVHATKAATFTGNPVRLWQGGSQVQAPLIELDRERQRLTAHGVASMGAAQKAQVHTILVSTGSGNPSAAKAGAQKTTQAKAAAAKPGKEELLKVMRIVSGELVYSGIQHQAEFSGGVHADTVDGTVRANQATVYLQQSAEQVPATTAAQAPSIAGKVERMVATGQVEIQQPGSLATGERLQYTAGDQLFVLTGDDRVQPKMVDAQQGTITGATITFHSGDKSVVVSNTVPGTSSVTPEHRANTETRADKDATIKSGK
jgi:lipopolysaccharide export system protein LptA